MASATTPAAGTAQTSERWWCAVAGSPVAVSMVRSARGTVEIGFIAARTRSTSPVVMPPSVPPERPDVRRGPSSDGTISSWAAEPRVLAKHLGEFTSREFARDGKVSVVVLRLGKVVRSEEVRDRPFDPLWVDERDVVHAVSLALASRLGRFQVFHIQSDSPKARFAVTRARGALKYRPQHQF